MITLREETFRRISEMRQPSEIYNSCRSLFNKICAKKNTDKYGLAMTSCILLAQSYHTSLSVDGQGSSKYDKFFKEFSSYTKKWEDNEGNVGEFGESKEMESIESVMESIDNYLISIHGKNESYRLALITSTAVHFYNIIKEQMEEISITKALHDAEIKMYEISQQEIEEISPIPLDSKKHLKKVVKKYQYKYDMCRINARKDVEMYINHYDKIEKFLEDFSSPDGNLIKFIENKLMIK